MAKKEQRITDRLNVLLSKVSSATGMAASIVAEMPAGEQKRQLTILMEQANSGSHEAFGLLAEIRKAAESI